MNNFTIPIFKGTNSQTKIINHKKNPHHLNFRSDADYYSVFI